MIRSFENTCGGHRVLWSVLVFYVLAGFVHLISWAVPDMKINAPRATTYKEAENVRLLWIRGDSYNSDWISLQNYSCYTVMNAIGFFFVQAVTLGRSQWWTGFNGNKYDLFAILFVITPLLFFSSVIVTWRSRHSVDQLICDEVEIKAYDCQSYSNC